MTELEVRLLAESRTREAHDLFLATVHRPPSTDQQWATTFTRDANGRVFGAFAEEELVGTAASVPSTVVVPGGEAVPAAAVSAVGVRPDHTRRGGLTSLMGAQLGDVDQRGEPLAMLHASESVIYGRYGYGVATRNRKVSLTPGSARFHSAAPNRGHVRLVDRATARQLLPEIYARMTPGRAGMIGRTPSWWNGQLTEGSLVAVHSDPEGKDDGFAVYQALAADYRFDSGAVTLRVFDVRGAGADAVAGLWRFLLEIDLSTKVVAIDRPLDEPLEWWLADRRNCRVDHVGDDLWLRLVDVPTALAARAYGGSESVIIEVSDAFLPRNTGQYLISPDGAERVSDAPRLGMDVATLSSLFLGDVTASTLAAANRVTVWDPTALAAADRLFATLDRPWCGTAF